MMMKTNSITTPESNRKEYVTPSFFVISIEKQKLLVDSGNASTEDLKEEDFEW